MPTTVNDRSLNANDISVFTSLQTTKGAVDANPVFNKARRLSGTTKRTIAYTQSGEIKNNQQGKQQIQDTKTYPTELSTEAKQQTKEFLLAALHAETVDNTITDIDIAATATGFTVPGHGFSVGDFIFVDGLTVTDDNRSYYVSAVVGDDITTSPAPSATEAAGNSITVSSIKSTSGTSRYYYTIQERMLDLSAAGDVSYRTYLDSQINSLTFEVPETGVCTSTVSFVSEIPVNGSAAITGQTDGTEDASSVVNAINNVAGFWVDGVDSNCSVKSMTLEVNNNLQEDRSAGCERVGYDGRSFEATGSLVTKAYISDARDWQRKYENGTRFNVAVELYWPEDSRKMIIVIEQGVATEHDMPTEANAIASNSMSYAAEESLTSGKTITVYANF
jgi:hypothetical protein